MDTGHLFIELYRIIYNDIKANKNLELHRRELFLTLDEIDKLILLAKKGKARADGYEYLRNKLYYLIYEISERT